MSRAIAASLVVTLVATVLLGPLAAAAHGIVVGSGWAYNVRAKRVASSWLPFALAFGALPTVAFSAALPPDWSAAPAGPPGWVTVCGALLGVSAHLVNAAPDVDDDLAHGIRGLPQRLGGGRSVGFALLLLAAATTIGVRATDAAPALIVGAFAASAAGIGLLVRPPEIVPRWAFLVVLTLIVAVVGTVAAGV